MGSSKASVINVHLDLLDYLCNLFTNTIANLVPYKKRTAEK